MSAGRVKVIFKPSIDPATVDTFAGVMEVLGHVYRTQDVRSVIVMPPDARRADTLRQQLAVWEKEGAVESWGHAT
jgi:hypothetical protein